MSTVQNKLASYEAIRTHIEYIQKETQAIVNKLSGLTLQTNEILVQGNKVTIQTNSVYMFELLHHKSSIREGLLKLGIVI